MFWSLCTLLKSSKQAAHWGHVWFRNQDFCLSVPIGFPTEYLKIGAKETLQSEKKIKQKLGRENQPKWNLAERLSWDLVHMMLFDSASTWVNTCLRHLWLEPEISELETGCTCLWPRQFRVVLTLHSRRSERWSWQHATPVCRVQILQEGQSSGLNTADEDVDLQVFLP